MLHPLDRDLWLADGPTVPFMGLFPYPTRMAVVRLRSGELWIWSPVPHDEALASELAELGPVRHLIAPNKIHHLFLGSWAEAYPDARLWAAPGLAPKRPDLHFHGELSDEPEKEWADDIDQVVFGGSLFMDEVVFGHRASRTVFVTDLIQRFPAAEARGWRGALMRMDGLVGERGSTPREWRLSFWNRTRARAARSRVLAWEPERLVIAHGQCTEEGAREIVADALGWMGRDREPTDRKAAGI